MEALAILGLVVNIVDIVKLGGNIISKIARLWDSHGLMQETIETQAWAQQLMRLATEMNDTATSVYNQELQQIRGVCDQISSELILEVLKSVRRSGVQNAWRRVGIASGRTRKRGYISELEERLRRIRDTINLYSGQIVRLAAHVDFIFDIVTDSSRAAETKFRS